LAVSVKSFCQINNQAFNFADTLANHKWALDFQSLSYFHNREYFGEIADGYTLFGNFISPKLRYNPSPKVDIEAGVFLRKDFGNERFTEIKPIFTVVLKKDSTQFRFGNIKGNLNHQLIEPLYNFEGVMNNNLESGFQLSRKKNGGFFDLWVDWQRMIYQNSPFKEEIWGGLHWKPKILQKNCFSLKTPIQFTAYHKGGQITTDKTPLKTEINLALGLETSWIFQGGLRKISLQNYVLGFKEQSNFQKDLKSGTGLYLNANFEYKYLNSMLSYFYGNAYSSKFGGDLYQSINKNHADKTEKLRNLLVIKLYKDFKIINNLYLIARFEPYWDLNSRKFEHSEGLFISYKEVFGLK
jgi:hypothetical protein